MNKTIEELDISGFQIVKSDMFVHLPRAGMATCTIWPTRITFSKKTLQDLNNCENIRLEVNPTTKCILIIPTLAHDKDSIHWVREPSKGEVRNMESKPFGEELYKSWNLDQNYNYRTAGRLVAANNKVMMLFDFSNPYKWQTKGADKGE